MFDIGFSELILVMVVGLVVLGPKRLPVAVKTVAGWIRVMRTMAATVQNELAQELKLQELQDSLKKVEQAGIHNLSPELKASMDELKQAAEALQHPLSLTETEKHLTAPHDAEKQHDEEAHAVISAESAGSEQPPVTETSEQPAQVTEPAAPSSEPAPLPEKQI
ncbi:MAG: Sec-independent protein translocase protein TatB [Enterobacteriaceae bacterium]